MARLGGWFVVGVVLLVAAGPAVLAFTSAEGLVSGLLGTSPAPHAIPSGLSEASGPSIGSWTSTTGYPNTDGAVSCVTNGGFVYCVGGASSFAGTYATGTFTDAVYFAPLGTSGIGAWSSTTPYPTPIAQGSCVANSGFIYCVGGSTANPSYNNPTNAVYYAPLSSTGVGTWTDTASYPGAIYAESCVTSGDDIYCIAGSLNYQGSSATYYATLSSAGVGTWTAGSTYPVSPDAQSCAASGGTVYCTLGSAGGNGTYSAPLSSSGIGSWSTTTNSTWSSGIAVDAIASDGYLLLIGGCVSPQPGCFTGAVSYAKLSGADVGAWGSTDALPVGAYDTCVVSGTDLYCLTGSPSAGDAYFASSLTPLCPNPVSPSEEASVPVGYGPNAIAYDSANGYIYVADSGSAQVTVINGANNTIVGSVSVGGDPRGLAVDAADDYIYVANAGSGNLSVIAGSNDTVVGTVSGLNDPDGGAYDSANGYVYVVDGGGSNLTVVNGSTALSAGSVTVGYEPQLDTFDSVNGHIYVSMNVGVVPVKGSDDAVLASISTGTYPAGLGVDTLNDRLYVANTASDDVTVIKGSTDADLASVPAGSNPEGVAFDSGNGYVYVTNVGSDNLTVINGTSDTGVGTIPVGASPYAAVYDPVNGCLYVADSGSDNVTVINTGPPSLYAVTFTETGLPSGADWTVELGDSTYSSHTSAIVVSLPNGTYPYSVANGFGGATTGSALVVGSPVTVPTAFYKVSFKEKGLLTGTSWNVTTDGVQRVSTGTVDVFYLTNGSYFYAAGAGPTVHTIDGSYAVSGAADTISLKFKNVTFAVEFKEKGLPGGTAWQVTFDGVTLSSTSTTITFEVVNGTYSYSIGATGYTPTPASGSITVQGAKITTTVRFS